MGYILIGIVIFLLLAMVGRGFKLPTWRIGSGMAAIAVFAVAGYLGLRGGWPFAVGLGLVGIWLAVMARTPRAIPQQPRQPKVEQGGMSAHQARQVLGIGEDATVEEIQAAYKRLMLRVHPDNGGAPGLAAQLNAARDRLLKG